MTTIIWGSNDSFSTKTVIYSGTAHLNPLWSGGGERLFSDDIYLYKLGLWILRMQHGQSEGGATVVSGFVWEGQHNRDLTDITPDLPTPLLVRWLLTHFLDDWATAMGSYTVGTPVWGGYGPTSVYTNFYPETRNWNEQGEYPERSVIDVEGPDYPQSPRVVVAFRDDPVTKIGVVLVSGLQDIYPYYATIWNSPLSISGIVTDLEGVRII